MKARLLPVESPDWAMTLSRMTHDFYHLPTYAALQATWEGGKAQALHVREGNAELLMPLVVRPIQSGGQDASTPYGYSGPVTTESPKGAFVEDAFAAGLERLTEEGIVSLFVRLHPLLDADFPEGLGTMVTHGDTVVVDLSLHDDELWRQTRRDHRNQINRARRTGQRVIFATATRHREDFDRLYQETMSRLDARSEYRYDNSYFGALQHALGDRLQLVVVDIDGTTAAAALFVETCGIVQYHLSASDDRYKGERPTKLLLHEVRRWAKSKGDRWLHLGGGLGGAEDKLLHFKAGFSELRRPFKTLRVVLRPEEYDRLARLGGSSQSAADPTGYFPAYRHGL